MNTTTHAPSTPASVSAASAAGRASLSELTGARRKAALAVGAVIGFGTLAVAGIGFVGSYAAVRNLAEAKGFGEIATVFPIGIDAGIVVLLALDLLFTWLRMPFPLLRHGAWLLTGATIAFNAATAWPDPVGTGMHATIPVLFVVIIEAARHAVGRIADLTANRHMESVRLARWLLAPIATFSVWRRMKLWEIGDYRQALGLEADRLICRARLRADYGRGWRRKAPMDKLLPLRLTKFGVPLAPASAPADSIPAPVVELERAETFEDYAADALSIATSDPVPALPTGAEQSTGTGAVPAPQQAPVPAPHNPHGHPDDDAVPAPPQMPANTPLPVPAETAAAAGQQAEPEAEAAPGPAVPPNLPAGYEHAAHATGKDTGTAPEPAPVPAPAPAPGHQSDGARTDAVPAPQQTPVSAAAPAPAPAAPPAAGKEPQPEAEPAPPEAPEHARKPARTAAATKRRTTAKAAVAKAGRTRRPTLTDDELLERVRDLGPGESLLSARYTARQVGCDDKRAKAALEALGRLRPPTP